LLSSLSFIIKLSYFTIEIHIYISNGIAIFGISRDTIRLWLKRERETGDFQALPNKPPGNGHKITDWGKFTFFVEVKVDKTQVEMAQLWSEEISDRTRSRALKKIGFTRKKKLMVIKSEMK
jgi:transposase